MVEVKETTIQSRCGIACRECEYQEKMGCKGCLAVKNPFWGICPVKTCCEEKGYQCCGECETFPCDLLNSFAYDKEQGDNGLRIENCKKWCQNKITN